MVPEDRYSRQRLIQGWDQNTIEQARVIVIGAGALGNEVLKNLALMGFGSIFVIDFDTVEITNLNRSVLFREADIGKTKVEAAIRSVKAINPGVRVTGFHGDFIHDLGPGIFGDYDLAIGCLDNLEARLEANRRAWRAGIPFVDGAIQALLGSVKVFAGIGPGPCYECGMTDEDWADVDRRYSCQGIRIDDMEGKIPATATIASIVSAVQVQEAAKLLHGSDKSVGKAFVYNGETNHSYVVNLPVSENCLAHRVQIEHYHTIQVSTSDERLSELVQILQSLYPGATAGLEFEVALSSVCSDCLEPATWTPMPLSKVRGSHMHCPACGGHRRVDELTHYLIAGPGRDICPAGISLAERCGDMAVRDVGIGPGTVIELRTGEGGTLPDRVYIEVYDEDIQGPYTRERGK